MLRPLVVALSLGVARVGADEPREWYEGNLSQVPDHRLVARQPVAAAAAGSVLFACSAASWDAVRFDWRLGHPADVSRSSRARSIRLEYGGRDVYVRDSLLRLSSTSPHNGTVHCTIRGPDGETRALLRADYSFLASSLGLDSCSAFCPQDRATCVPGEGGAPECRCGRDFARRDPFHGVCFAPVKLGQPCLFDHECEAKQSWCEGRVCACRPLFEPGEGGGCVPVARLGETCSPGQCSGPYSACRDGRCACYQGSDDIDGVCVPGRASLPGGGRHPFATPVFGELRTDSSTWFLLVAFCAVLAGITVCHTVMDARRFRPTTPAVLPVQK